MIIKDADLRKPSFLLNSVQVMVLDGATIEIRCVQTAYRNKEGKWKGKWRMFSAYQGTEWCLSVQARTKPKDHLSVDAVTSFADFVGITMPVIPLYEGSSYIFTREDFDFDKATVANPQTEM